MVVPSFQEVALSLNSALRENPALVITGDPGAGKTTLLKYIALCFARDIAKAKLELDEQRVPILVALRDFNVFLNNCIDRSEIYAFGPNLLPAFLLDYFNDAAPHLGLTEDFFPSLLDSGRCAVLFDGLDEVPDIGQRARMAQLVADIIVAQSWRLNRFVVTSRPRGYDGEPKARLSSYCADCCILPFEDKDIEVFTSAWYKAVTLLDKGDTLEARQEAADDAGKLVRAIHADPRVRDLARNPLLLSVLAMVHQRNVELPRRRARLYEECTDFLISYWDELKDRESATDLGRAGGLDRDTKRALLEPIALWLHERGEQGTEVDRADLEKQLAAQFVALGDAELLAKRRAAEFLRLIEERSGLLVERSPGVFAFAHLTFQEYLAARALRDRDDYLKCVYQHLHDPWWREVTLLAGSLLSEVKAGPLTARRKTKEFLVSIRNAGSWHEETLRRDLLFAVRCLGDMEGAGVDSKVRDALTEESIRVWQESEWEPQSFDVARSFAHAVSTPHGEQFLDMLLRNVLDPKAPKNWSAVKSLRILGSETARPDVLNRLLAATENTNDNMRYPAIEALGSLGSSAATPEVVHRLLELSESSNVAISRVAIEALGNLGHAAATPAVMERILSAIQGDAEDVRHYAFNALVIFVQANATGPIVERLLAWLQGDDSQRRGFAVRAFAHLGNAAAAPNVVEKLLAFAQGFRDEVKWAAVDALRGIGSAAASFEVVEFLHQLSLSPESSARAKAIMALGHMGSDAATPAVLERILRFTYDPDDANRYRAVVAFGSLGSSSAIPKVTDRLFELLQDTKVCPAVLRTLREMQPFSPTVHQLRGLLSLLQGKSQQKRWVAVNAFGQLGSSAATSEVVICLSNLANNSEETIQGPAIVALGNMGIPEFVSRMISLHLKWSNTLDVMMRSEFRVALLEIQIPQDSESQDYLAAHCLGCLNDNIMISSTGQGMPTCDAAYLQLRRIAAVRAQAPPANETN